MQDIHSDHRYIHGLATNDPGVVQEIYTKFSSKIKRYVLANSGAEEDAGDLFQEALVDIYQQAKYKAFQLRCPFEPFLLLVCKRKWLNQLKKRSVLPVTNNQEALLTAGEDVFEQAEQLRQEDERANLFVSVLGKMGSSCQDIIRKSMTGEHLEKVAESLGVSYGYLRKKKSECMAALTRLIKDKMSSDEHV